MVTELWEKGKCPECGKQMSKGEEPGVYKCKDPGCGSKGYYLPESIFTVH